MYVKNIEWLDEDIREAIIFVTDGKFELKCFSSCCDYAKDSIIQSELEVLSAYDIYIVDGDERIIYNNGFFYELVAKKVQNCLHVGKIRINIENEYIAKDIADGEYVHVKIERIDLFQNTEIWTEATWHAAEK